MSEENYKDTLLGLLERKRGLEIKKQNFQKDIQVIDQNLQQLNTKINYILDFNNSDYNLNKKGMVV